jgi:hypothetical protein
MRRVRGTANVSKKNVAFKVNTSIQKFLARDWVCRFAIELLAETDVFDTFKLQ